MMAVSGTLSTRPVCWVLRHGGVLPPVKTASGKGRMRYLSRKAVLEVFGSREGAWLLLSEVLANDA
jgi:DNA-binding IclR family transcriptional regulator